MIAEAEAIKAKLAEEATLVKFVEKLVQMVVPLVLLPARKLLKN